MDVILAIPGGYRHLDTGMTQLFPTYSFGSQSDIQGKAYNEQVQCRNLLSIENTIPSIKEP